jgi:hypothetical protein
MKRALVLGCSHAAGSEMTLDPSQDFLSRMTLDQRSHYEQENSFAAIIARRLGYSVNNQSVPGGSNDAIFRIFQQHLAELTPNDIVIVAWTGANRSEVQHYQTQAWVPFAPGSLDIVDIEYRSFLKHWIALNTGPNWAELNKSKNTIALNAIAQQHNIRVINLDSLWPVSTATGNWPLAVDFWTWCLDHKFPCTDSGHFYQSAHLAYAELVMKQL